MMPWFVWKGKNSLGDFGLWVSKFPSRVRAQERHEEIQIPGRSGSLIMLEGEGVYSTYNDEMVVTARNTLQIDKIVEWLSGSSDLILSIDTGRAREARIVNEFKFERVGNGFMQATIPFLFQPFRKSIYSTQDRKTITSASATITNPGDVPSKPIVSITGTGNNTITIAGNAVTFTGISGTIVVDCGAQIITQGNSIWSGTVSGELWTLPKGQSTITQTGSMSIAIDPEWRWL